MSDQTDFGNIERPQTVIGPITLGLHHAGGSPISLHPNSTLTLAALGFDGIGGVDVLDLAVSAGTLTLDVNSDDGSATITVSGLSSNAVAAACPAGTLLTAIARTHGAVVLHLNQNGQTAAPAFPVSGPVSVVVTSADGI